jgi:CheY-like chemotaxis protein
VDDAPEVSEVVRHLGRRAGHELVCRPDVPAAWEYLRSAGGRGDEPHGSPEGPDLVLLDVNLPGASGLELFRLMRSEGGALGRVPAALFVQWTLPAVIAEGLAAGIDLLVAKDLLSQPDAWKGRIEEVLELAAQPWKDEGGRMKDEQEESADSSSSFILPPSSLTVLGAVQQALRHPALRRLGDEVVCAVWARALGRVVAAGEGAAGLPDAASVDIWGPTTKLTQLLAPVAASRPTFFADLVLALSYQFACLLGRAASEPLRRALGAARAGPGGE